MLQKVRDARERDSCELPKHLDALRAALVNIKIFEKVMTEEAGTDLLMNLLLRRFYLTTIEACRELNYTEQVKGCQCSEHNHCVLHLPRKTQLAGIRIHICMSEVS